ncbi:kelch repeat-containing protein [Planctomycetota bacterium]
MKKKVSIVLVIVLGSVHINLAAEDTWMYKADMPTARVFIGGSVVNGKIYIIGGAPSGSSITSAVEMYDPITDTWTRRANMPSARCSHATCTLNDKIYVFGGTSPNMWSSAKKNVFVYDPQTDTWIQKADMPYANAGFGVAALNDTIYLIGGNSVELGQTVMAYNPNTESWTQKADMPTGRYSLSACVVDGKIYAIGGSTESWSTFGHVEVYDPSTDTWIRKSDMPTKRWGLGTCVVNGKIYAIGGNSAFSTSRTETEVYDPMTDTWTIKSPIQQQRYGLFVGSVGNMIYAIGGSVPGILSTVEVYDAGFGVPSPDFNGDGIIDMKDLLRLIESWGKDDPIVDIAPLPSGDGIVDALDLELLMSYWGQPFEDPSLIAHWALDETEGIIAYDSAGINDAVLIGGAAWHPSSGQINGALQLDGVDGYVVTGQILNPANDPFSVFAWVKEGAPGQVVFSQLNGTNWLGIDPDLGCLMTELMAPTVGRFTPQPLKSDSVITDGQWHRIGFVWDGSNRALYVDDILVAEDTQANLQGSDSGLYIGTGKTMESGTYWSGLIDDVRIYNRAVRP